MDTLGERLEWILRERAMSRRALSMAAGLSQSHVGQIIRGQNKGGVAPDIMKALAEAGGVNLIWLMTGEGKPDTVTTSEPFHDEEAPIIDRAIRYVFGNAWPPPELEARIRERAELTGFSSGADLGMLAGLVERTRDEWRAAQSGMPPKTKEVPPTKVELGPNDGMKLNRKRKG